MKMRLNLIIALLIGLGTALSGQVQLGVKGIYGVNYNNGTSKEFVNISPLRVHNISSLKADSRKGLGLSLYTANDKLFFMTDAQYVTTGRNFELLSNNYSRTPLDPAISYETTETDLRLAVTSGFTFKNFKFGVGPELSYSLSRTENLSNVEEISANDENYKAGFNFLVGYEFLNHLHLDLKHTYMFNDVSSEFSYLGSPMNMKNNQKFVELSLGLYF